MYDRIPTRFALLTLALTACSPAGSGSVSLEGEGPRGSYALGFDVGESMRTAESEIDRQAFMAGFEDGLDDAARVEQEERVSDLEAMVSRMRETMAATAADAAAEAQERGAAFLAENAQRAEVTVTESGLQYEVLQEGDGPLPSEGDQVRLHYRGTLTDGTEFDSSLDSEPVVFTVGGLIPGFNEAMQLIPMGAKYKVYIPSELGYGPTGAGQSIGPNEVLVFEIEHFEIVEQ